MEQWAVLWGELFLKEAVIHEGPFLPSSCSLSLGDVDLGRLTLEGI